MKKNIIITILIITVVFVSYSYLKSNSKVKDLTVELVDSKNAIDSLNSELDSKINELKASKAIANTWAAKAYQSGYKTPEK
ncbi:hypothetical protein SAMN05421640_1472 [Ekhidna lutea]|uniref:Uncharacterized protein n=1 Tax=Ekhidna lutea TaxID=447679 RepID=A0A239HSI8_EKHLU|nr:hypothetical protein [Ekhidna lutea]SNS84145.1 hypothetical protein SAMN05421640_1472 [Ekhidna lutea]